jgi:iron-regulated transporter 1
VGRWCDTHPSRLQTLRITIFLQRICVVFACLGWFFIVGEEFLSGGLFSVMPVPASRKGGQAGILDGNWLAKAAIMAVVMILGIGERLSAVGNMIVMERDWVCFSFNAHSCCSLTMVLDQVPRLATGTSKPSLPELNAVMRRIDLICKLLSPIFMSAIVLWTSSMRVTILITAGINFLSMGIEWFAARRVWRGCERLQAPKVLNARQTGDGSGNMFKLERWRQSLNLFFRSEIWIRENLLL